MEVNPTKLAPLLLISITVLAAFSGMCIAITSNANAMGETTLLNPSLKPAKIPGISVIGPQVHSADPIGDGKPN